ncbi:hypothetical protein XENTR_v10018338 [Xenopus tropicalis]|nr:hypothetical protein XENTR_v10018338 [Xenopus tropicalis]
MAKKQTMLPHALCVQKYSNKVIPSFSLQSTVHAKKCVTIWDYSAYEDIPQKSNNMCAFLHSSIVVSLSLSVGFSLK